MLFFRKVLEDFISQAQFRCADLSLTSFYYFFFFGFVYLPLTVKSSNFMCQRGLLASYRDEITGYTLCMQNAG